MSSSWLLFFPSLFRREPNRQTCDKDKYRRLFCYCCVVLAHVEQIFSCVQGSVYLVSFISLFLVAPQSIQIATFFQASDSILVNLIERFRSHP